MRLTLKSLAAAAVMAAAPAAAQEDVQAAWRAAQARAEADRAAAEAQAQAAAAQARIAREESERLSVEARRRADALDEAQRALAIDYARRRAESEAQAQAERSESDLVRRAAEQRAQAAEEDVRRVQTRSEARDRIVPTPALPIYAPRPRSGTKPPAQVRSGPGPDEVIAMNEGVVLCQRDRGTSWRCNGPLRVVFGDIAADRSIVAQACGRGSIRDLGSAGGMRAFGCGFGINRWSTTPGNRDVPAIYGIAIRGRQTFRCPRSREAYCETR